jgi:hypothetical protein
VGEGPIVLQPDEALFVVSMQRIVRGAGARGRRESGSTFLTFGMVNPETHQIQNLFNARQDSMRVLIEETDITLDAVTYAFVAPAGTYTLTGVWTGNPDHGLRFCLGSIATQVEPGEVVHLGAFTVRPGDNRTSSAMLPTIEADIQVRVDPPDLTAARDRLQNSPDLAARLRIASWRNGLLVACSSTARIPMYGFDVPDAPMMPSSDHE